MTTAKKPARTPRAKKQPATSTEQPKCQQCGKALSWHDLAYCGGVLATMCKVCHSKAERKRLHGVFVPAAKMPKPPMAYGTERITKMTARPAWKAQKPKAAPKLPTASVPAWERAAKRLAKNTRRRENRQARKERAS